MKVLVTGGAGFIGSHVLEELIHYHYEVIVLDNLVSGFRRNIPKEVKLYEMDINEPEIENIFRFEKPDYVIHLAAQASVSESLKNPSHDFETNMAGTVNITLLSKKYNVKKLLYASTAAVYGEPAYLPIDEKHPLKQHSYYALSKYSAEKFIKLCSTLQDLNYCILRFSNVYGPKQNAKGEAGVISTFISQLLGDDAVTIYDGSQTRDFIYVKDVASACRLVLEGEKRGVFNISSGTEMEITELYYHLCEEIGVCRKPIFKSARIGDIKQSVLDNAKVHRHFDWRIRYSLMTGLKETIQFYTQSENLRV